MGGRPRVASNLSTFETLAARPPRTPIRWAIVAVELLVLVVGLGVAGFQRLFTTVDGVQHVIDRLVGDAPVTITITDVEVVPWSHWYNPASWQLCLSGVHVVAERVDLRAERLVLGTPDLIRAWATRKLQFDHLRVVGLDVGVTPGQPKEWAPKKTALERVIADEIEVWDGSVHVAADGPVPAVDVTGISGVLQNVQYAPGTRESWGRGWLTGRSFRTGSIDLRAMTVGDLVAEGSSIRFGKGSFTSGAGGGSGTVSGRITSVQRNPAVEVDLNLVASVAHVVETATGRSSPLDGKLHARLRVHAGGELGPGGAWMEGDASLDGGVVTLGESVKPVIIDLLHVAPFVRVDNKNRLHLEPMTGSIAIHRGRVDVKDLEYKSPRQTIQLRGTVDEGEFGFVIRLMPRDDAKGFGVGLVIQGRADELRARLATRDELASGEIRAPEDAEGKKPFWLKFGGKKEPKEPGERRLQLPFGRKKEP